MARVREEERCIRYMFCLGKHEGKGTLGRPGSRWEDYIKIDLQEIALGEEHGLD